MSRQAFLPTPISPGSPAICTATLVIRHGLGINILAESDEQARGLATARVTHDGHLAWKLDGEDTLNVSARIPNVFDSSRDQDAAQIASALRGDASSSPAAGAIYQSFRVLTKTEIFWIAERADDDAKLYIQWALGTALLIVGTGATLPPVAGISSGSASLVCRTVAGTSLK